MLLRSIMAATVVKFSNVLKFSEWGWGNNDIMNRLQKGDRHPRPDGCPKELYKIMLQCWDKEPANRPSFAHLTDEMREFSELGRSYENED